MNVRQTTHMSHVGGGAGGMPPRQPQMRYVAGLAAAADPEFVALRAFIRREIFKCIETRPVPAHRRRLLPVIAKQMEYTLYRKYPNKMDYGKMAKGPIKPLIMFVVRTLHAESQQHRQNQQWSRQIASSTRYGIMIPTPGITQGASETSTTSYLTYNMDPSSGAGLVPGSANSGTSLRGGAPDEHVNTMLSQGILPTQHGWSRASNNNLVINTVDTPETNKHLACPAPSKDLPKEPKFSCPVCMNELVDASSTICGHIFCQKCIEASIQAQSKCPTCRRMLTVNSFHRIYLPTMD
ncbi:hypothetical protein VPH35_054776 [Triticum aestivum]|nr:probable histone acetyltransferase HAC-like 1 isoform X2 [Triticum aestivum]